MHGFEALMEIRADCALRGVPVIAIFTTATDPELADRASSLGGNEFLGKPSSVVLMRELMATVVHRWLDLARLPKSPG